MTLTIYPKPRANLADWLFLWVPRAHKPGFTAFLMILARLTLWPILIVLVLLVPFTDQLQRHQMLGASVAFAVAVLFEELGRYSFVRRADNRLRAIIWFTCLVVLVETLSYYNAHLSPLTNLLRRAPSVLVHILAGAAMLWALRQPKRFIPAFILIYVLHVSFDLATIQLFGDKFEQQNRAAASMSSMQRVSGEPLIQRTATHVR